MNIDYWRVENQTYAKLLGFRSNQILQLIFLLRTLFAVLNKIIGEGQSIVPRIRCAERFMNKIRRVCIGVIFLLNDWINGVDGYDESLCEKFTLNAEVHTCIPSNISLRISKTV